MIFQSFDFSFSQGFLNLNNQCKYGIDTLHCCNSIKFISNTSSFVAARTAIYFNQQM